MKVLWLAALLFLASCSPQNTDDKNPQKDKHVFKQDKIEPQDDEEISEDYFAFGNRLEEELLAANREEENFGYSATGLQIPLGIAANFAEGSDREEVFTELGADPKTDFAKEAGILQWKMTKGNDDVLAFNNSVWINNLKPVDSEEVKKDAEKFIGNVYVLPFNESAGEEYRKWQEDVLGEAMSDRTFDEDQGLLLANALKFSGNFRMPFTEELTKEETFYNDDDTEETVDMMHMNEMLLYSEGDNYKQVLLPMENGFTLRVVLPDEGAFDDVLDHWPEILTAETENRTVDLALPKLSFNYEKDLTESFENLRLFDYFANRISPEDIKVSDINQISSFDMDEKGVSVKTLTEVGIEARSAQPMEPVEVTVDRPFLLHVEQTIPGLGDTAKTVPVYTLGIRNFPK